MIAVMSGMGTRAVCRDVDLPALVIEALDKVASPTSRAALIDGALARASAPSLPLEVHRMLLFVTGPLLETAAENLGPEAAAGLIQDLRPVLERAFEQVVERAGLAETHPPPSRPLSGFLDTPNLKPPSVPRFNVEPPHGRRGKPPSSRRSATMPYMAAVKERGDVVVVDDDPLFRRGLTRLLGQRGYEVIAAADGTSALKLCQRIEPVLVITDWRMPGLDGAELAALITEAMGLDAPPVVMLTGAENPPESLPGVAKILTKGASLESLLDTIAPLLVAG
jgi:CheY-like chemotaxis protein